MKKISFKTLIAFSFIIPLLFSCKKTSDKLPSDPVPIDLTVNQVSLITSENSFALDIFDKVVSNSDNSENVIISPLSISTALSMTLNGANGTTRDAMLTALKLNGLDQETINNSYKNLTAALLSVDSRVLISIANSVWTEKNFVVKKTFIDILTQYYSAESKSFDILNTQTPSIINGWIETNTNGLIKNMIDQLNPDVVMMLINAIYFKGKWTTQFDKDNTVQGTFFKSDGSTVQVPMMKQTSEFKVFNGEGFLLAELPYGQGNFVMDVILPGNNHTLENIIPLINATSLAGWLGQMTDQKGDLFFPRFKYGYKKELKDIFKDMGMGIAFTDQADFSNIADADLEISSIMHQAFIETNEEGTEAAAATVVTIVPTSANLPFLNFDHPFAYIIRETSTNTIVFMGKVEDPLAQ